MKKTVAICLAISFSSGGIAADVQSSKSEIVNLATAYCENKGGKVVTIKSTNTSGKSTKCLLPTGEFIEQWKLYKRDHK
ncbi:DUF333 domain-containing protein [Brenneria sp. 4F2]|nr:DUF333 domain-containing protein [Brenneria bubanii]